MKRNLLLAVALTLASASVLAHDHPKKESGHAGHGTPAKPATATTTPATQPAATSTVAATYMAEGEVRKIDKEQGKVTLKHGEIKHHDMPAMTMVFKLKDPQMLDKIKEGDKVKFDTDRMDGAWTVTKVEAVK